MAKLFDFTSLLNMGLNQKISVKEGIKINLTDDPKLNFNTLPLLKQKVDEIFGRNIHYENLYLVFNNKNKYSITVEIDYAKMVKTDPAFNKFSHEIYTYIYEDHTEMAINEILEIYNTSIDMKEKFTIKSKDNQFIRKLLLYFDKDFEGSI